MDTLTDPQPVGPYRTPGSHAAAMLMTSEAAVAAMVATGVLDGLTVGGVLYVHSQQILTVLYDRVGRTLEDRDLARRALRLFLDEHPATASWQTARGTGVMVCAPSGPPGRARSFEQHAVVVRVSAVVAHAMRRVEAHPEFHGLPVPTTLAATLCGLPGVRVAYHATPRDRVGGDHRLTGWLRLDQAHWPARAELVAEVTS